MAGALRVSKTTVAVLFGNPGKLRVSKTWVSVLTDNTQKGFAVTSVLALTSTLTANRKQENVASPLSIVHTVNSNRKQENVASSLALLQALSSNIFMVNASNVLELTQDPHSKLITISVANQLSLVSTGTFRGPLQQSVGSFLNLQQVLFEHFGIANRAVVTRLDFVSVEEPFLQQFANVTYILSAGNVLPLVQSLHRIHSVSNVLAIVQATTVATGISVSSVLNLIDTANPNGTFGRSVASPMDIDHSLTYFIERKAFECQYNPFVGENGDDNDTIPPSATPPVLGNGTLTLTHPFVAPTTTLVLRNPEFGDTHDLAFSRINRETRGGTLIVFADPVWPKTQVLQVTVEALTDAQTNSFLTFLATSLGQEIGLLDWHNRQWRGLVTTPEAEVTDGGNCRKNVSFEFEGELV